MIRLTAKEIVAAISGNLTQGRPEIDFSKVSSDTRTIHQGDLFFALKGENFDAHDFIQDAISRGAQGIVVEHHVETGDWSGAVIEVKDTLKALQELAACNRAKFNGLVVGVTGSNGKTTTKDMIYSVLQTKYNTLKTEGNYNNHIGLPTTLLKLDNTYGAVIVEMGMRGLGEIDLLASIARPQGAVITNIGVTHIERLGSREKIAQAKGEILDYIPASGFAVLNGDDILVQSQAHRCKGEVVLFGTGAADIRAKEIKVLDNGFTSFTVETKEGTIEIHLPIPGEHNVMNALAAVGVGLKAGLTLKDIKAGLENVALTKMRLEVLKTGTFTVINDTYNANPDSVKASLVVLNDIGQKKRKVAILGDMFELGDYSREGHQSVGTAVAEQGIDVLVTVGHEAQEIAIAASLADKAPKEMISFSANQEAIQYLQKILLPEDVVLVKGSRGMKMEEIVQAIVE